MTSRLALVAAAAAMSVAVVATPAPASAGVFASLARMAIHTAERAVIKEIKKEMRGGSKRGGRHLREARY